MSAANPTKKKRSAARAVAKPNLPKIVIDDLRRSGLDAADAAAMCIVYDAAFIPLGSTVPVRAYHIPYFDLAGKLTSFYRVRLLDPWTPKGEKKPRKYTQPGGTTAHLYFPPVPGLDWRKIAKDTTKEIAITEGEKKAYALCKIGVPCIGLGGVWNWLTREDEDSPSDPIDDLGLIEWVSR